MDHRLSILAVSLIAIVATSSAVAASGGSDKMTICHHPDDAARQTMQVPRSAWSGHKGHGDAEGACQTATTGSPPPPPAPKPATTSLALRSEADGDLDGDATFELTILNTGDADGLGLRIEGKLAGDGTWRMQANDKASCTIEGSRLACTLKDLGAGGRRTLQLAFEGHTTLCREAGLDLVLKASNDVTKDDDRVAESARVGACSVLHDH